MHEDGRRMMITSPLHPANGSLYYYITAEFCFSIKDETSRALTMLLNPTFRTS